VKKDFSLRAARYAGKVVARAQRVRKGTATCGDSASKIVAASNGLFENKLDIFAMQTSLNSLVAHAAGLLQQENSEAVLQLEQLAQVHKQAKWSDAAGLGFAQHLQFARSAILIAVGDARARGEADLANELVEAICRHNAVHQWLLSKSHLVAGRITHV
jgi:hypothetical protein